MSETLESLKTQLKGLPSQDRAELAGFLIESLDDGEDDDAEAAWERELARRVDEIRSDRVVGKLADQVFAKLG